MATTTMTMIEDASGKISWECSACGALLKDRKGFDIPMFYRLAHRSGDQYPHGKFHWPGIDIAPLASFYLGMKRMGLPNFKLMTVARALGVEVNEDDAHDAMYDIEITRKMYYKLAGLMNGVFTNENRKAMCYSRTLTRICGYHRAGKGEGSLTIEKPNSRGGNKTPKRPGTNNSEQTVGAVPAGYKPKAYFWGRVINTTQPGVA